MTKKNKSIRYTLAVPLLSNDFKIKFTRKTEWTIIDYLFLKELSAHSMTIEEMSTKANLPKQLTLQILLPLCEMGWVCIVAQDNHFIFQLTASGKSTAESSKKNHELPSIPHSYTKVREVHVDDFDNYYDFYKFGITPINQSRLITIQDEQEQLVVLNARQSSIFPNYDKIKQTVRTVNTEVNSVDDLNRFKIETRKYLLLEMIYNDSKKSKILDNKMYEILPNNLVRAIEETLPTSINPTKQKNSTVREKLLENMQFTRVIEKDNVKFIYSGEQTQETFFDFIEKATDYLIIHSTFIGDWAIKKRDGDYTDTFILLKQALAREVKVYILWGKTDDESDSSKDEAVKQLLLDFNEDCRADGMVNLIEFNNFVRTDSHAKFLITNYNDQGPCVMLSSCNFLYAQFSRFEASIVIHDAIFAKKFLEIAANLACGTDPSNTVVRTKIRSISNSIADSEPIIDMDKPSRDSLTITLVLKGEHYKYIDLASHNATKRIFITSDWINDIPQRPIYDRLKVSKAPQKCLFYTKRSSYIEANIISSKSKELLEFNPPIKLRQSSNNNHSKVLAWDNNDILITSLNWLSSDASLGQEDFHEIGLHVHGINVAKAFIGCFNTKN